MARSPKSDPQREEVYRWEKGFSQMFYGHGFLPKEAHRLERAISRYYDIPRPRLRAVRWGKRGFLGAAYSEHPTGANRQPLIVVNEDLGAFTAPLLAHEISHIITDLYGIDEPDHGERWLGAYLHVLDRYAILPLSMTVPSAKAAGLRFRDPALCTPKLLAS